MMFAIDELDRLNRESAASGGRLNLNRIGVAGHSFGVFTTLTSAGIILQPGTKAERSFDDPRIKAAAPMSAPIAKRKLDETCAAIIIPCLHMTGTKDYNPIGETCAKQRRIAYDHSNGSDQFLITFKGDDHMIFSGRTSRADPSD